MNLTPFFNFFCGRATAFAIFFTVVGSVLAFLGHLDASYVALVTAVQGLVFAHSWKEDIMEWKNALIEKGSNNASQSN